MGDKKITVNCIAPGGIKTDMYHAVCREYIPGGDKLNDDEVDEYAKTWSPLTASVSPLTLLVWFASLLAKMESGSTVRF